MPEHKRPDLLNLRNSLDEAEQERSKRPWYFWYWKCLLASEALDQYHYITARHGCETDCDSVRLYLALRIRLASRFTIRRYTIDAIKELKEIGGSGDICDDIDQYISLNAMTNSDSKSSREAKIRYLQIAAEELDESNHTAEAEELRQRASKLKAKPNEQESLV